MPPPRAAFAESSRVVTAIETPGQTPAALAELVRGFIVSHPQAAVLEDGKLVFELAAAQWEVTAEHGRCLLQVWSHDRSQERNLVRTVVAATERNGTMRLSTRRFGHAQTKLLQIVTEVQRSTPARREPARKQYLRLLERVLAREFPDWQPEAFRTAMDLERSFGPAYARGSLVHGKEAWAVIGVGAAESQAVIDGILTLGILWLHHCRERGDGRRLYKGLRIIVPHGAAMLTLARLAWMNTGTAQWELYELNEGTEEFTPRDATDQGNLRTRLVHASDERAARERFTEASEAVLRLVPAGEISRVEQRLRSSSELAFLLHGLEFARAKLLIATTGFRHVLEITAGNGASQTLLTETTRDEITEHIADLFRRRNARATGAGRAQRSAPASRSIGAFTGRPAHAKMASKHNVDANRESRLELRDRALAAQQDPLFRAAPERWLESVLRENLAPLTRSLAPVPNASTVTGGDRFANEDDPDTRGNRLEAKGIDRGGWPAMRSRDERVIPRFDPRFVYTQVPAIAGASDRGMLDLLGVTADRRLAVIELKASDDLQLALQGLDYWIRVRHHHAQAVDPQSGLPTQQNDLQRHGYFREVELSPQPPRLYLVAPALHIHPATETILRYLSPSVEWTLLALDERWRQEVRVVWRKSGGRVS
ncbi:MAG: hypothetical protein ACRYFU_00785 [Janthinobacterium lividum]